MSDAIVRGRAVTYAQTLKPAQVETPLDLAFYRPVAWLLVRLALPTPLSANGMTALSILVGLAGAALFARTDRASVVVASVLTLLYAILDCADGQLARARGTSSRVGRILDGTSDYVVGTVSGVSISLHLSALVGPWGVALAIGGLGSVVLQGTLFDYFKNRYLSRSNAAYREGDDLEETRKELARVRSERRSPFVVALLLVYVVFLRVQRGLGGGRKPLPAPTPEEAAAYARRLAPIARGWAWLGPSTHVALMGVLACTGYLVTYVWIRLTLGNVLMAALWLEQRRRERALRSASRGG